MRVGGLKGINVPSYAKPHFGSLVVLYTLEDTVELWNHYLPFLVREERVRQFLFPSDLEADLRRRDGSSAKTTDSEGGKDGCSVIATDDEVDDNTSLVSQEYLSSQETLTEAFDNFGRSIFVRSHVDREDKVLWGSFNGEFTDVFQG
jgi:hypothetical protein